MQRVTPYEAGRWRCEVREYITRWNLIANPRTVSMNFNITVLNKVHTVQASVLGKVIT